MNNSYGNSSKPNSSSQKRYRALEEMERERQKYAQSRGRRYAGPDSTLNNNVPQWNAVIPELDASACTAQGFCTRALTFSLRPPPFSFVCHINHPPYNNRISNERALRVADIARARASDHRQVNRGSAMRLLYKSGLRRNR